MYTVPNQANGNMTLNETVDYTHLPQWTNLNSLHSLLPASKDIMQTNGFCKIQPRTHLGKGAVTHFNNFCPSIENPADSLTGMKYPRIFRPVILQHHPEYSRQTLPSDRPHTLLHDSEPLTSTGGGKGEIPNFLCSLGPYDEMKKNLADEKFYKRVFQFQFSISESVKENNVFLSRTDSEVASQFLTLNNASSSEENLPPVYGALKPTNLDLPYIGEINQQSVNRQDRWESFPHPPPFITRSTDIDKLYYKEPVNPYRSLHSHKELIPNWLPPTKQTLTLHDRNDRTQAGATNWVDPFSVNGFNPINMDYPASDKGLSKRSEFWKQTYTLENLENTFGNIPNISRKNSEGSSVLTIGNNSGSYFTPTQKREMSKKLNMCPYCNRTNSSQAQLKIHLRIHTGERPYVCDIVGCDKTFTRNEELTRHLKIHSGYRPYICKICQRSFGRKDHLTKHEVTHRSTSDKKVHLCLVAGCKQRYTRSDALARHRWNVHFIRPQVRNIGPRKN